jgi:ABC-type multidrug transport system fused ATPase/permease subunit
VNLPLRQYIALLAKYLKPHWRKVALLSILLAANIGLQLINPQIVRQFIDTAQSPISNLQSLTTLALLFALTAILGNIAAGLSTYVSEDIAWAATNHLRSDLAQHTLALDMTFHKAHTAGEMIERIDGDVTALSNFFSQFVVRVLGTFVLMGGVLVVMYFEDWRIGLAMTAYAVIVVLVLSRAKNIAVPHFKAQRQASADLSAFWEERLSGLEDIRSSGAETYTLRQQFSFMRTLYQKSLRASLLGRILFAASIILFSLGNATAIGVGGSLLGMGALTLGTVYLIFDYTGTLSSNLRIITDQLDDLQRASAGIERVAELVGTESKITSPPDPLSCKERGRPSPSPARGGVGEGLRLTFHNVSFVYDDNVNEEDNAPVLQHIDFELQPGKVLGLLGRTGSGKTTLTRLLFRFYDPVAGHISLNGIDVRDMKLSVLRKRIGLVTQEVQLFQASVRDNLTFFDPSISDERILQVLGELGLVEWLSKLRHGLDTELESGNGGLSAGEAQLLAFARVFLADPALVVMDEASSRLDPATEQLIERAVDKLLRGRTALIIAHHLGTVQRADEILILEDGRMIEYGARLDLIANPSSRFSQLLRTGLQEVLA